MITTLLWACSAPPSSTDPLAQDTDVPSTVDDTGLQGDSSSPDDTEEPQDSEPVDTGLSFTKVPLFEMSGSAFIHPADLDGDGFEEYLLSAIMLELGWANGIGPGGSAVISRDAGVPSGELGDWTQEVVFDQGDDIYWPNDPNLFDVNNDGIDDWVVGTGFLPLPDSYNGRLVYMEGYESSGSLAFMSPDFIDNPWTDLGHFYHKAYPHDFNGDGHLDFVTASYRNADTDWLGNVTTPGEPYVEIFLNDGIANTVSYSHHTIANVGGVYLAIHDIDADGDMDLFVPQFFGGDSLVWLENTGDPTSGWQEHLINNTTGKAFDVELADMNGDGRLDLLYGNHNHQLSSEPTEQVMGVYWFEIPEADQVHSLSSWDAYQSTVVEGFYVDEWNSDQNGAPGVCHAGDVNQDGRMDVSVAGDGDDGMYVYLQQEDGSFSEVLIDSGTVMSGDHHMADLDGDGDMDYIWAIYGELDLFSGDFGPQSAVNIYLQD